MPRKRWPGALAILNCLRRVNEHSFLQSNAAFCAGPRRRRAEPCLRWRADGRLLSRLHLCDRLYAQ